MLSVAETARLAWLATDWTAGLLTHARLVFRLRWSAWRRRHPGHGPVITLRGAADRQRLPDPDVQKEMPEGDDST